MGGNQFALWILVALAEIGAVALLAAPWWIRSVRRREAALDERGEAVCRFEGAVEERALRVLERERDADVGIDVQDLHDLAVSFADDVDWSSEDVRRRLE